MKLFLNIITVLRLALQIFKEYNKHRQRRKEQKQKFRDSLREAQERAKKKHEETKKKGPKGVSDSVNRLIGKPRTSGFSDYVDRTGGGKSSAFESSDGVGKSKDDNESSDEGDGSGGSGEG